MQPCFSSRHSWSYLQLLNGILQLQNGLVGLDSAQPGKMPIAEKITEQVICLPIYPELNDEVLNRIINVIKSAGL